MEVKLHYISYDRRKPIKKFVLQNQSWSDKTKNVVVFDVTETFTKALKEDQKAGYEEFTGPAFGHEVCKLLLIGRNHAYLSNKWIASVKTQDDDFMGFVDSYLQNSKSMEDFFEQVNSLRKKQNQKSTKTLETSVDEFHNLDDVDVLDFRPMISYKGVWKNMKPEYMKFVKTWDYGTVFKNK